MAPATPRWLLTACAVAGCLGAAGSTSASTATSIVYSSLVPGGSDLLERSALGVHAPLVQAPGFDAMASVSRDGRSVAFVSNRSGVRRIMAMRRDGADLRTLSSGSGQESEPAWSPDGRFIAFVSDRTGTDQIFVMRADGSEVRQLTASARHNDAPSFSPDGETIAFVSTRDFGPTGDPSSDVFTMRADGSAQTNVSQQPGGEGAPVFAADGRSLIYSRDVGGLWSQDLVTGTLTQLTDGPRDDRPDLSADGATLVFDGVGPAIEALDGDEPPPLNYDIYALSLRSGSAPVRRTDALTRETDPTWAPSPVAETTPGHPPVPATAPGSTGTGSGAGPGGRPAQGRPALTVSVTPRRFRWQQRAAVRVVTTTERAFRATAVVTRVTGAGAKQQTVGTAKRVTVRAGTTSEPLRAYVGARRLPAGDYRLTLRSRDADPRLAVVVRFAVRPGR